jgi:spore germination protein GerM
VAVSARRRFSFRRFFKRLSLAMLTLVILAVAAAIALVGWYLTRRETAEPAPASGEVSLPRGLRSVTLYFPSAGGDSLVAVERQVMDTDRVTETVQALVDELVRGPGTGGARAAFPEGVSARHVFLDESGSVYVDFSPELVRRFRGGSTAEYLLLASLVRTLAVNLPTVNAVVVTVGGKPVSTLGGHFGLEAPLLVREWR